jgi:hypothetical protein
MENPMLKIQPDPRVDAVYKIVADHIDWDNAVPVCIEAAIEIQQFTQLKGPQKLELLQNVLKHALRESNKTPTEKEQILYYIDTIVPFIAQAAKLASKTPIAAHVVSCWKKCMV